MKRLRRLRQGLEPRLLRELTELGARVRLEELLVEQALIVKAFPSLDTPASAPPSRPAGGQGLRGPVLGELDAQTLGASWPPRRRPPMTARQRADISRRMKKRWRDWRARRDGAA